MWSMCVPILVLLSGVFAQSCVVRSETVQTHYAGMFGMSRWQAQRQLPLLVIERPESFLTAYLDMVDMIE